MPGPIVCMDAQVQCVHGGQAQSTQPNPRVLLGGTPAVVATAPFVIAGCPLPTNAGGPCLTAQVVTTSLRVTSMGLPLVLQDSQGVCAPTGAPLLMIAVQPRVVGM
jgi:hypothetical protein